MDRSAQHTPGSDWSRERHLRPRGSGTFGLTPLTGDGAEVVGASGLQARPLGGRRSRVFCLPSRRYGQPVGEFSHVSCRP